MSVGMLRVDGACSTGWKRSDARAVGDLSAASVEKPGKRTEEDVRYVGIRRSSYAKQAGARQANSNTNM